MGTIDKAWEEIHSSRDWGQYPSEHVIRFVARNYYNKKRDEVKILDFGIGGGAHTWYLAREGFDTYGFDGSPSAVRKTEARLARENLKAKLICATGQDVEYERSSFDAVIDSCCIYANVIDDILSMYKKVFSFLKEGGKFLTIAFGKKTSGYGSGRKIEDDTYTDMTEGNLVNRGTTHFYTKHDFISILENTGFRNVKCDVDLYTDGRSEVELLIASGDK